jgi:uncharacterized protein YraI
MTLKLRRPRARSRRAQALAIVGVIIIGSLSAAVLNTPAASAAPAVAAIVHPDIDPNVHTLVAGAPEAWAPYLSNPSGHLTDNDFNITISCYLTGDSVTGPYGAENVWDEVSGGEVSGGTGLQVGTFVPDADLYTGSNSPIVPPCSTAPGQTIGGNPVPVYNGPGTNNTFLSNVASGTKLELRCYSTGTSVSGPYGSENIWDLITVAYFGLGAQSWVPDALVYTGSNSAVVPHC